MAGIDPGFASIGYGVLELGAKDIEALGFGVVRTEKSDKKRGVSAADDNLRRAQEISRILVPLVDGAQALCFEAPSLPRNAATSFKLGLCYGIIACLSETADVPIVMVTPKGLKKALCGNGSASKEEVAEAVTRRLGRDITDELLAKKVPRSQHGHVYDAFGSILANEHDQTIRALRRIQQ